MADKSPEDNESKNAWNGSWHSESESHWHSSRVQPGRFTGSWYNGQVNDTKSKSAQLVDGKVVWSNTRQKNPVSNLFTARQEEVPIPAPRTTNREAPLRGNPANPASPNINRGARPNPWTAPEGQNASADGAQGLSQESAPGYATAETQQAPANASSSYAYGVEDNTSAPASNTPGQGAPSQRRSARRSGISRNLVEYDAHAPERAASPESNQETQRAGRPSWYNTANASSEIHPRSVLDQEFHGSRRDTQSQRNLHLGKREHRRQTQSRGIELPFSAGNGGGIGNRIGSNGFSGGKSQGSGPLGFNGTGPFGLNINVILIAVLVVLIVIAFFVLNACSSNEGETQQQETLTANDTAADAAQTSEFTVSFAGDCTLGTDENFDTSTNFTAMVNKQNKNYSYFFKNVKSIFEADDLTVVNFEGTLTNETNRADKKFAFKGPKAYTKILTSSSVEAASTANNHSHDYGTQSYTDTVNALDEAGIQSFGYDNIAYMDVKGTKVALIGTYELAEGIGIKDEMVSKIKEAKENGAQVIIDYIHWGIEREATPDSDQRELGHAAIDAGATLVVGSHPHVIQGYEQYNGRYIVYSMGNFCFGGNANPTDKDTWIFQQTFKINGDTIDTGTINTIPCSLSGHSSYNDYQPTPATGSEKKRIAKKIKERSDAIS